MLLECNLYLCEKLDEMNLEIKNICNSLNKAYLAQSPFIDDITLFKENYTTLLKAIQPNDNEETLKDYINDFLKNTYYKGRFATKENVKNIDLVILNGKEIDSSIGVIVETKAIKSSEMITENELNKKAFQELIQYYLEERVVNENIEIKHLIITNSIDWFIFNASEFERLFYQNKSFLKQYNDWHSEKLVSKNKDWFYSEIAKPFVENSEENIVCTYVNLQGFENFEGLDDQQIIELYKIFSPEHLLKLPFQNDSNTLNREFYNELLHILGLQETKVNNVRRIERLNETERNDGSFIENTIHILLSDEIIHHLPEPERFGETEEEQLFSIGLELCITWLNRILFLKLLESQLVKYNKLSESSDFRFLNSAKIRDFEELRELFFEVLAVKTADRKKVFQTKYEKIPYLNSSLFELTELEKETVKINQLKNHYELPVFNATVLKDDSGKKTIGTKPILQYLFEFLDSYNFASDNKAEIQEKNKTIINSSVLGLIFEKINGYKEGSYYTPGFVTMYMCRENIRKAVIEKFKPILKLSVNLELSESWTELYNEIDKIPIKQANEIFNSIKICDPAVGSGHFLVSALNELVAIKSDLKILIDKEGRRLRNVKIEVINDELYISDEGQLFSYHYKNEDSQTIQETIFHEKQKLIENCLFGVDINPKSVNICRLRLWIELLKNAYYEVRTGHAPSLQTLPNIDINIKCGNSLISHFSLNGNGKNGSQSLKRNTEEYKIQVNKYKNTTDRNAKREYEKQILSAKENFAQAVNPNDEDLKNIRKLESEQLEVPMFFSKEEHEQYKLKHKQLETELQDLKKKYEEKKKTIYQNAFEWRFEFPEVLDDNGYFVGFDLIIGNPPYIRQERIRNIKNYLQSHYKVFNSMSDLLTYFIELSYNLLHEKGHFSFIISNKFAKAEYGDKLRSFLLKNTTLLNYINFSEISVFDEATVDTCIISYSKNKIENPKFQYYDVQKDDFVDKKVNFSKVNFVEIKQNSLTENSWTFLSDKSQAIMQKVNEKGTLLKNWNIRINFGIKTGFNEAFIIDQPQYELFIKENKKNKSILKPLLRGRDIKKYTIEYHNLWIINSHNGIREKKIKRIDTEKNYPTIFNYLKKFETELIQRQDQGDHWSNLRNCAYVDDFEKNKIIYPEFATENSFTWDTGEYYGLDTTWFIVGADCNKYLLALLNSKLIWFYLKQIVSVLGTQAFRMKKIYLEQLPLIVLNEEKQQPFIKIVDKIIQAKKNNIHANTIQLEEQIDKLVYKLYNLSEDEIAIIER